MHTYYLVLSHQNYCKFSIFLIWHLNEQKDSKEVKLLTEFN